MTQHTKGRQVASVTVPEVPIATQVGDLLDEIAARGTQLDTAPARQALTDEPERPRRVVVTGMGTLNPLAHDVASYWDGLSQGRSGVDHLTLCDASAYPTRVSGEVKEWNPRAYLDAKEAKRMSRVTQFAVAAALEAVRNARLEIPEGEGADEYGVVLGTGNCAYPETEAAARLMLERGGMRLSPFFIPSVLPNMAAAQIALQVGLRGYNSTIITACASGTQAIGEAAEIIRRGDAEVVLTGGAEAPISELGLAGFSVLRAMTHGFNDRPAAASRPFDRDRDGFVPAEGAAILVVEELEHARARGATIHAEVLGAGVSCDAYHLVAPEPNGLGAMFAMRRALRQAKVAPRDIQYINAHGTSTELNDRIETLAVKKVFGEAAYDIPMSSTKSMVGHALGAAGAMEAVATILAMQHQVIPPTINLENPDPECDLDYVANEPRPATITLAMSNSFGFGGHNASLVLRKWDEDA